MELARRIRPIRWRLAFLVLVLLGAFAAAWYWEQLNPFAADLRNMREAQVIMETTQNRPLTDAEIERLAAILHCGTPTGELSAVVTLDMAVGRAPGRRDQVVAILESCPETASPTARDAASQAVIRLKAPQKHADELLDKALHRRLTDDEFERLVALVSTEPAAVQLSAIQALQIAVGQDPGRRERVIAALEKCPETASPKVRQEASEAATRLKGPKPLHGPRT